MGHFSDMDLQIQENDQQRQRYEFEIAYSRLLSGRLSEQGFRSLMDGRLSHSEISKLVERK